jgi:hypothetical protein
MFPRPLACLLLPALIVLGGCRDRQITSYRAAKDPAPSAPGAAPSAPADMATTAVPTGSGSLSWKAPTHWTAKAPGAMRKGSFAIKGADGAEADLSITAFPGDTGGLAANVNRWRGQIALPALTEEQLHGVVEHADLGGHHFDLVDVVGTASGKPTRIVGAILSREGETWFFKLMGPDALVAGEKAAFREFLGTVQEAKP